MANIKDQKPEDLRCDPRKHIIGEQVDVRGRISESVLS